MARVEKADLADAQALFREFFRGADVGLAIFDERVRYRAVNSRLQSMNGFPAESHIGKTPYELFDNLGSQVESAVQNVFSSGSPVLNVAISGVLPGRSHAGHWINNFFAIRDTAGMVKQVGAVIVELPDNVRLRPSGGYGSSQSTPVLRSWKEIAWYLGTCVKTVQRWEQIYNFPVRRLQATKGAAVFALQHEVEEWMQTQTFACNDRKFWPADLSKTPKK